MSVVIQKIPNHNLCSKPVKQEVNGTVILPPLVFPAFTLPGVFVRSISDEEKKSFVTLKPGHLGLIQAVRALQALPLPIDYSVDTP
jgi:hypothetical protein